MKKNSQSKTAGCSLCCKLGVALAALLLAAAPALYGNGTGNGTLTVDNNQIQCPGANGFDDSDNFNQWEVFQNKLVHLNITAVKTCTAGAPSNINKVCGSNTDCGTGTAACQKNTPSSPKTCQGGTNVGQPCGSPSDCPVPGVCTQQQLECSGATSVVVQGHTGTACTSITDPVCTGTGITGCDVTATHSSTSCTLNSQCTATGETGVCDTGAGFCYVGLCTFSDSIATTVSGVTLDACYTTRATNCDGAFVSYCGGIRANAVNPGDVSRPPAHLLSVGFSTPPNDAISCGLANGEWEFNPLTNAFACEFELDTPQECTPATIANCTNQVGSFCCSLTQGAYGASNGIANGTNPQTLCADATCSTTTNYTQGIILQSAADGNNVFNGDPNATTIGIHPTKSVTLDTQGTLVSYLPAGGPSGSLTVTGDVHYPASGSSPTDSVTGGGTLAGQTMTCGLNSFLSGVTGGLPGSNFGGFTIPSALVCTKRAGEDKTLGTGDDVCAAFSYPSCTAGKTISQVQTAANQVLGGGTNPTTCSPGELTAALGNMNNQFDECGVVIACGSQTTAGVFTCPSP